MISAYLCALVCISFLIIASPASAQVDDPFLSETQPLTKDAPARPLNRAKPMPSAPTGPPASSKQPSGPFLPQSNAKPAVPPQSAKSAPATNRIPPTSSPQSAGPIRTPDDDGKQAVPAQTAKPIVPTPGAPPALGAHTPTL